MRGDETVSIFGHLHKVRAELRRIESLSGHGDYSEMINYIGCQEKKKLKKLFLVHGEEQTQFHFRDTLSALGWKNIEIPEFRQEYEL
jgi:metallo-beta-lactamase family protein